MAQPSDNVVEKILFVTINAAFAAATNVGEMSFQVLLLLPCMIVQFSVLVSSTMIEIRCMAKL